MLSLRARTPRARRLLDERRRYIDAYAFPRALREKVQESYEGGLSAHDTQLVLDGLRQWFVACLYADGKLLGMPSRAADDAWHEFIVMTREYHVFCERAFGRYLHHTPDALLDEPLAPALARTLRILDRHAPAPRADGLPLLFVVDVALGIEGGHVWTREEIERAKAGDTPGGGGCGSGGDGGCGGGGCGGG